MAKKNTNLHYEGYIDLGENESYDIEDIDLYENETLLGRSFGLVQEIIRDVCAIDGYEMAETKDYENLDEELGGDFLNIEKCVVTAYISDRKLSHDEVVVNHMAQTFGGVNTLESLQSNYGYSAWTILGMDLTKFTIGNHDLIEFFKSNRGKYVHFNIKILDKIEGNGYCVKENKPQKIKLFTHTDLDGIGCAVVAKAMLENDIDITYCKYEDINEKVMEYINNGEYMNYKRCHITDISINKDVAAYIDSTTPPDYKEGFTLSEHFFLTDHHKNLDHLKQYWWCFVKEKDEKGIPMSGTELFYETLWCEEDDYNEGISENGTLARFKLLVGLYDTWRWKEYGVDTAKDLNDLFYIRGREDFLNVMVSRIKAKSSYIFAMEDKELLDKEKEVRLKYIEEQMKYAYIMQDKVGRTVVISKADKYINEVCEAIYTKDTNIKYVVNIGKKLVNFRTDKDDIDLSLIAKEYGGGGHQKASGCPKSEKILKDYNMEGLSYVH